MSVDPRLLADYDVTAGKWRIAGGRYTIALSTAANAPVETQAIALSGRTFGR